MQTEWVINSITEPSTLKSHKEELETFLQHYPYLATLHAFKAKLEQIESSLDYQEHIKKAAVYAPKRDILYNYVIKPNVEQAIAKQEDENESHATTGQNESATELSNSADKDEKNAEIKQQLEKEILNHAISASILSESNDLEKDQKLEKEKQEQEPAEEQTPLEIDHKMDLLSWLHSTEKNSGKKTVKKGTTPKIDLIDSFIEQGNEKIHLPKEQEDIRISINRPTSEFFSPENMAKMSLAENEDFVTETLAKIYAKQGNIKKAIFAYEKLSLKFPEKSNYFARLIQELKQN